MNTWERFTNSLSFVRNKREQDYHKKLVGCAKACLMTAEGEFLVKHLIEEFGLDDSRSEENLEVANYRNGEQDAIKYILGLIAP